MRWHKPQVVWHALEAKPKGVENSSPFFAIMFLHVPAVARSSYWYPGHLTKQNNRHFLWRIMAPTPTLSRDGQRRFPSGRLLTLFFEESGLCFRCRSCCFRFW